MSSLGTLTLDLVAEVGRFNQGLDQASRTADRNSQEIQRSLQKIDDRFASLAEGAKKLGAALGVGLSVVAFNGWIHGAMQAASSTAVFAQRIDVTVESLTRMRYVAEQAGVSADTFDASMMRLTRRLGAAKNGGGPAIATLDRLGLSAKYLLSLPLDQRLESIGDAMKKLETQAERLTAAQDLAGDSARQLVPMWMMQADEINNLKKEAEQLGYVYSEDMAKAADAVLGKIANIKGAFNNLAFMIAGEVVPTISDALDTITSHDVEDAINGFKTGLDYAITAGKIFAVLMVGRFAASLTTSTLGFLTARIEALKYQAALASMAGVSRGAAIGITAMGTASRAASLSMAALGGPVGIIAIAASSLLMFGSSASKAGLGVDELGAKLLELDRRMVAMSMRQMEREAVSFEKDIISLEDERRKLEDELKATEEMLNTYEERLTLPGYANDKSTLIYIDQLTDKQVSLGGKIDDTSDSLNVLYQMLEKVKSAMQGVSEASDNSFDEMSDKFEEMSLKLQDEIGRIGLNSNVSIFEYELENTSKYDGLSSDQIKFLRLQNEEKDKRLENLRLSNLSNRSSSKKIDLAAEYKRIMEGTLSNEERRSLELQKSLGILQQYGATEEEMLAVRRAAFESMAVAIPGMGEGGDTLTAQMARINENVVQLDAWREQQLAKLEMAYGMEESALAESLARKEEIEQQYRERRSQFETEMNQEILSMMTGLTGETLASLEAAGLEHNAIYKGMFLANKAVAFANAIVSSQEAGAKALAIMPGPAGIALSKMITGFGMVNAGVIAGTALQGFSSGGYTGSGGKHDPAGIVHKGEVVFSQDDIRRLGGVSAVESIRLGNIKPFFDGGIVGGGPGFETNSTNGYLREFGSSFIDSLQKMGSPEVNITIIQNEDGSVEADMFNQFGKKMDEKIKVTVKKEIANQRRDGGSLAR